MTKSGMFQASADDECIKERAGDYCMKSGDNSCDETVNL